MNQYIVPQEDIYGDNFLFPYVSGLNIPPHHHWGFRMGMIRYYK